MEAGLRSALSPPARVVIWEWAEKYIRMPNTPQGTPWDSEDARWLRKILEDFQDPEIHEIYCMCSAQSGKTVLVMVMLLFMIAMDPGPTLWATSNEQEAKKFAKGRLWPMVEKCQPAKDALPTERGAKNTLEVYFPGAQLVIGSANNANTLQQTPYRYTFGDEVRSWPKGALEMFSKRTRSYPNYKRVIISTPDMEQDHLHRGYLSGNQNMFYLTCPDCGNEHILEWGREDVSGGMKWDRNETTCPSGTWDFQEVFRTVRYDCWNPECDHRWKDTPADRKRLQRQGQWVEHNDKSPSHRTSYNWNAILPWWTKWTEMVEEFIKGTAALEVGDHQPFKVFWTESLGLAWEDRLKFKHDDGFIDQRESPYDPRAPWEPFEQAMRAWDMDSRKHTKPRRFMAIDVQAKGGRHFYWEVRDVVPGGGSRAVAWGKAWSSAELRSIQEDNRVPASQVGIDARFVPEEVATYIVESGLMNDGSYNWKAMMGDKGDYYNVDGVKLPYQISFLEPFVGTSRYRASAPIKLYLFKKAVMLERQELLMRGLSSPWLMPSPRSAENPRGADPFELHEYKLQLTAYRRVQMVDRFGSQTTNWHQMRPDDHYGSTTRMIIALSMIAGLLAPPHVGE